MDFDVDPDGLRTHGKLIEKVGADSVGALSRWQDQLAGNGAPWGSDLGEFGAVYRELVAAAGEVSTLITDQMTAAGQDIRMMGDNYETVDTGHHGSFRRIEGTLGERS